MKNDQKKIKDILTPTNMQPSKYREFLNNSELLKKNFKENSLFKKIMCM